MAKEISYRCDLCGNKMTDKESESHCKISIKNTDYYIKKIPKGHKCGNPLDLCDNCKYNISHIIETLLKRSK